MVVLSTLKNPRSSRSSAVRSGFLIFFNYINRISEILVKSAEILIVIKRKLKINAMKISKTHFNIKNLVEDHVKIFDQVIKKKKINVSIKIPRRMDITADKYIFEIVLDNLLNNSIKFIQTGTISIDARKNQKEAIFRIVVESKKTKTGIVVKSYQKYLIHFL